MEDVDNEMLVIKRTDLNELVNQLKKLNNNFENLNFEKQEEKFMTRKEVEEHYGLSERATTKIFTKLLKDKVIDIGKVQRLAKSNIDKMFKEGVILK